MSRRTATAPSALPVARLLAPTAVRAIDVRAGFDPMSLPRSRSGEPYLALAVLARHGAHPIGWFDLPVSPDGAVSIETLEHAYSRQLGVNGRPPAPTESAPAVSASVSIVVTTCADPDATTLCIRKILDAGTGRFEVIVADNRPAGSPVRSALAREHGADARVRYVEVPEPGLSRARNAGTAAATGEIIAFIDDDVVMDDHWFHSVRRAFAAHPEADCVTGLILPLELETASQLLIQRLAAFDKGFAPRTYSIDAPPPDQPLFPYTAGFFGSGANMALRRDAISALGGFDPALGAGSPALGGEDLDMYVRLLLSGRTLVYLPAAIVWHRHPDEVRRVSRQAFHYGIGLGAMATKQFALAGDRAEMMRRLPEGVRYLLSSNSRKNMAKGPGYPRRLELLEWIGLALGPVCYLRSIRRLARDDAGRASPEAGAPNPGHPANRAVWCGEFDPDAPRLPPGPLRRSDGRPFDEARLLVRSRAEPVGFVHVDLTRGRLDLDAVRSAVPRRLNVAVDSQLELSSERDRATTVSVIVCTRDRPNELRKCLAALQAVSHPQLELLVVDNAPSDDRTARLVAEHARDDLRIGYVLEPRPGLSCARNRGLREASGEVIAFTDDDVRVDPLWLAGLLRGFRRAPDVGCVTGLVASASLEHPAERYFHGRVWWSTSCEQRLFRAERGERDSRLHPYAAGMFGTGANIAFRAEAIQAIGGFDESLGVGSPTGGGEDLDAFVRLLRAGYALTYEPAALVWHEHRVDERELHRQMYGYGKGLSAYLFKHLCSLRSGPKLTARLLLALRHAFVLGRRSQLAAAETGAPPGLMASEIRGLVAGPAAYVKARRQQTPEHVREVAP